MRKKKKNILNKSCANPSVFLKMTSGSPLAHACLHEPSFRLSFYLLITEALNQELTDTVDTNICTY